jgi:hypothetical protein
MPLSREEADSLGLVPLPGPIHFRGCTIEDLFRLESGEWYARVGQAEEPEGSAPEPPCNRPLRFNRGWLL